VEKRAGNNRRLADASLTTTRLGTEVHPITPLRVSPLFEPDFPHRRVVTLPVPVEVPPSIRYVPLFRPGGAVAHLFRRGCVLLRASRQGTRRHHRRYNEPHRDQQNDALQCPPPVLVAPSVDPSVVRPSYLFKVTNASFRGAFSACFTGTEPPEQSLRLPEVRPLKLPGP
jgi:hypothetical protein